MKPIAQKFLGMVGCLLIIKAVYIIVVALLLFCFGDTSKFEAFEVRWPRVGPAQFVSHFAAWDCAHYLLLAIEGYAEGVPSCAFYPLWPLILRCLQNAGVSPIWGGIIVANIASACGWALFHDIAAKKIGVRAANLSLILLIAYPGSMFYQMAYTESIFMLEVIILMYALSVRRMITVICIGVLLPLTRAVGVFVVIPLAYHLLIQPMISRHALSGHAALNDGTSHRRCNRTNQISAFSCIAVASPILGWAIYALLMWLWTGNLFEGFVAQKNWGRHSISNIFNIHRFLIEWMEPTVWHGFSGSLLDRIMFLPVLMSLPAMWRRHREWLPWVYVLGILPAMSGEFTSYTRFCSVSIPCFWAWGEYLSEENRITSRVVVMFVFIVLHMVLLWRFVNFEWAG